MNRILATAMVIGIAAITTPVLAQNNSEAAKGGAIAGGAAGAVGGALVGGPVGAVVGGVAGAAIGATTGSLTPEDRVYVREYAVKQRTTAVRVREPLVVGEALPSTVKHYPIMGNPRLESYNYAYVNDDYYIVDREGRIVGEAK